MEIKLTLWYNKYKIQNLQWLYIYMYLNVKLKIITGNNKYQYIMCNMGLFSL